MANFTLHRSIFRILFLPAILWATSIRAAEPPIVAVAFAPDGQSVVIGSQRGIQRRSWPDLEPLGELDCQLSNVHDLTFSPDGAMLAAVGGSPAESGSLQLYRWPAGTSMSVHRLSDEVLYQAAWRGDGLRIALAGGNGRVLLADLQGRLIRELAGHSRGVTGVAFLEQAPYLVSVGLDQTLRVWDANQGTLIRQMNNHTRAVRDVAARPDDPSGRNLLATASDDGTVRLWWPVVGRLVRFVRLDSPALAIDWSHDGQRLLAACRDGHLRVIDPDTVKVLVDIPIADGWAYAVAASPKDRTAVVGASAGMLKRISYADE